MKKRLALLLFFGLSIAAAAAEKEPHFRFRKAIELGRATGEEIIAVPLDSDVYAGTRDGFPDLRIADDRGAFVPYLLERIARKRIDRVRESCASKLVSLRVDEGKGLEVVVALDEKSPPAGGLTIETPLADYEHHVRVFGSQSGEDWIPLVSDGLIFDYSRFMDIRNRDIALPANEFRQFKLVVDQELDDRESPLHELIRGTEDGKKDTRIEITRKERIPFRIDRVVLWRTIESEGRSEPERFPYAVKGFVVDHDAKTKCSRVEIESRREPLTRLSFETASKNFSRTARVLVPVERGVRTDWVEIGRSTVVSIQFRAFHRAELRVDFPEQRQERYRLEIENADNPPLEINAVDVVGSGYHLVFLRSPGRTYRLEYGSQRASEPVYDTAAVLASVKRGYHPATARVGPQTRNVGYRDGGGVLTFLNSPVFLVLAIVIMVVVLAWALFRAGMRIQAAPAGGRFEISRYRVNPPPTPAGISGRIVTLAPCAFTRLLHDLGLDDLRCQAETHEDENYAVRQVELPPAMPHRGRRRVVVMVVVPSFAKCHHAHEPVVPAAFIGVVIAVAEEMRKRIDRPGGMPAQDGSHHATPNEQAEAELECPHLRSGGHPSDQRTRDRIDEQVPHVNRRTNERLFQAHVERVFENIMRILVHRGDGTRGRVVIKQPVEVRPEEVDERAVGIGLFVGKNVVHPVNGHPLGRAVLQRTLGEQCESVFEPLG